MNQMDSNKLIEMASAYLPADKVALVRAAYEFAARAHQGQVRKTGEPYVEHPLNTAMILAELQLDAETLAAALLHDVPEDCSVTMDEIEAKFGPEVAKLVDGVTKMAKLTSRARTGEAKSKAHAENLRKGSFARRETACYRSRDAGDIRSLGAPSRYEGGQMAIRGLGLSLPEAACVPSNCPSSGWEARREGSLYS